MQFTSRSQRGVLLLLVLLLGLAVRQEASGHAGAGNGFSMNAFCTRNCQAIEGAAAQRTEGTGESIADQAQVTYKGSCKSRGAAVGA